MKILDLSLHIYIYISSAQIKNTKYAEQRLATDNINHKVVKNYCFDYACDTYIYIYDFS